MERVILPVLIRGRMTHPITPLCLTKTESCFSSPATYSLMKMKQGKLTFNPLQKATNFKRGNYHKNNICTLEITGQQWKSLSFIFSFFSFFPKSKTSAVKISVEQKTGTVQSCSVLAGNLKKKGAPGHHFWVNLCNGIQGRNSPLVRYGLQIYR